MGYYLRDSGRDFLFVDLEESVADGEAVVEDSPWGWLLTAGFRETGDVRAWMHRFPPVLKQREEEMALFFLPDFVTLLQTRFAAGRGGLFEKQFAAFGQPQRRLRLPRDRRRAGSVIACSGRSWRRPSLHVR